MNHPTDNSRAASASKYVWERILSEMEVMKDRIFKLDEKVERLCVIFSGSVDEFVKDSFGPAALQDPLTRYIAGYVAFANEEGRAVSPNEVAMNGGWKRDEIVEEEISIKEEIRRNCNFVKKIRNHMKEMERKGILASSGKRKKKYVLTAWVSSYAQELKDYYKKNSSNPPPI
jgi:hypothetical protein